MNLALFLPNWVGDVVMATPTLRALRRHFGRPARIVGILRPALAELLAGTDWLDETWCFDPHGKHFQWGRMALVARMRRERFDMAVLLTHSLHTALLAWLGGAKERIGYVRHGRGPLLTGKLYPQRDGRRIRPASMVDAYLGLARAIGCPPESPRLELVATESEQAQAERVWRALDLRTDGRVIALNSTGAYGAAKVWPAEHCGTLAREIVRQLDHDVLVLCGPAERQAARDVVGYASSSRVVSLADQPVSLSLTKALLARSRLLVSTDSGPRHMAAALDRPVVTLLGPTSPVWIENPTVRGSTVRAEIDCLGCGRRTCPLGHHHCMRNLAPDRVLAAVAQQLDQHAAKAA